MSFHRSHRGRVSAPLPFPPPGGGEVDARRAAGEGGLIGLRTQSMMLWHYPRNLAHAKHDHRRMSKSPAPVIDDHLLLTPVEFARRLRREQTEAEARLWQRLRNGALGVRFRRQH